MKKLSAALLLYLGLASAALAQTKFTMPPPAGVSVGGVQVVSSCGAASGLAAGNLAFMAMDTTGAICTSSGGGGGGSVTQGTSPWVVSGTVTAAQSTAANLNATVVGTGTFAVQAATQGAVNTTLTDCSGTITSGGTAQNAFTAAATRHGFTIANIDTSEVLWLSFTTTAAASGTGSYPLAPATATTFAGLSSFTSPLGMGINTAISVIAATTAHKFSCTVW